MNLMSCENCGVVVDGDNLPFTQDFMNEDGVDDTKAVWSGVYDGFVPAVPCPVCGSMIPKKG